ncbi:MAG TPA: universal stress protein [Anaerolineales bacterium]|nr:universal stress protein [Anaerolineales bacterium]
MLNNDQNYLSALQDFNNARRKASIQELLARLTGKSSELLSYEDVAKKLKLNVRTERGVFDIPLKAIIGSVGRYNEFTRSFLPRKGQDKVRWARVKTMIDDPMSTGIPPIEVYKVGEVYFVLDGNHRVSVAREEGFEFIEAHVIEVKTAIPLGPDTQPDDLIIKAEYADFLAQTDFATIRPGADLSVSVPGQYGKLLEHIQVHRYFMGIDLQRDIPYPEAVGHWFDVVYSSIIDPVRERGLMRWFPGRTETDLYLWVSEYRSELENELGWSIRPEAAAQELASTENPGTNINETGSWRMAKMIDRYTDRLFKDILVPITGSEDSWQALEQAVLVAKKEGSDLHGLHVIPQKTVPDENLLQELQNRFDHLCQESGLHGRLMVEKGSISRQVCERALLADLIVLFIAHPPSPGLPNLYSGLRTIIRRSARPILTVSATASAMDNVLLAYDGSAKSKEALFVAAYLAEKWQSKLTVLTIGDDIHHSIQDYARSYLDLHEIRADYVVMNGPREIFIQIIDERQINLVIMGSYSGIALKDAVADSTVNYLLRKTNCSLLICR